MSAALEAIKALDKDFIAPKEAASVLGCDPYSLNVRVMSNPHNPDCLGFPFIYKGKRLMIPRLPFIQYVENGRKRSDYFTPEEIDTIVDAIVERLAERLRMRLGG